MITSKEEMIEDTLYNITKLLSELVIEIRSIRKAIEDGNN